MKKETKEEYLETLYKLYENGERDTIKTGEIAEHLEVSPPTVTEVLPMLESEGYLEYNPYYGVKLTEEGFNEGKRIVRSHRILEVFLKNYFSLEEGILHDKACQMEHIFDAEMINILEKELGNPETCPHGNKIPSYEKKDTSKND